MAKSQKRSNRELKKPKLSKTVAATATPILINKAKQALVSPRKKT